MPIVILKKYFFAIMQYCAVRLILLAKRKRGRFALPLVFFRFAQFFPILRLAEPFKVLASAVNRAGMAGAPFEVVHRAALKHLAAFFTADSVANNFYVHANPSFRVHYSTIFCKMEEDYTMLSLGTLPAGVKLWQSVHGGTVGLLSCVPTRMASSEQ